MSDNATKLIYRGQVELYIKIKGKFYHVETHNEGMPYLKYIFSKYLAGDTISVVPSYIDLFAYKAGESIDDENAGVSFLQSPMVASGKTYSDAIGYYTEFKTYLSSENLTETINVDDDRRFYLYLTTNVDKSTKKSYKLARIKVETALLSKITPGTTGTVVWKMRLLNDSEVEQDG